MDDHEIVDLYWQRDEHAIEATAAKYESYCMKISQNILSDRADSEENVNDTYLHAWNAMPPQRPAISLDELDDSAPALSSPDDEATAAELGRSISAFLRTQSEEVRSMFILRYFYCEPVEALAARFHCGESRIKTTLLRTRRKLKEHLIKEGYCEA